MAVQSPSRRSKPRGPAIDRNAECFVFVRYWPSFISQFPYDLFNCLSENAIDSALRIALCAEFKQQRNDVKRRKREASERRRRSAIAAPTVLTGKQPREPKSKRTRAEQFHRIAYLVGWHRRGGPANFTVSPRVWIARQPIEIADGVLRELAEFRVSEVEHRDNLYLNPRFGIIRSNDLSAHERVHAISEISRIRSTISDELWADVTRALVIRADQYISHASIEFAASPADSGASDLAVPDESDNQVDKKTAWLAKALMILNEHPEWSDAKIARRVNKSRSTLSRNPTFKVAASLARGSKENIPAGFTIKDPDTGRMDVVGVDYRGTAGAGGESDRGQKLPNSKFDREYCSECREPIKVPRAEVGKNPRCERCGD